MAVITFEGTISDGHMCFPEGTRLPKNAKFFLIVPDVDEALAESEPIVKTFETVIMSKEEWATRIAEIDSAYEDFPDEEEAMTRRLMRSKAAKVSKRDLW